LILAGSGPVTDEDLPRNTAVVLDRQGNRLWQQDKLCDYTLAEKYVKDWKLTTLGEGDLFEDIRRGEKLVVAETSLGRLAILICEDLSRCGTRSVTPRDIGVSHLLTPVFDAPLNENGWERYAAQEYIRWTGSRVVVSNSRVVGNLQQIPELPRITTALGVSPQARQSWDYDAEAYETHSPTDAVSVRLRALGPPMRGPDDD
jgi:predicted amidohydrolase